MVVRGMLEMGVGAERGVRGVVIGGVVVWWGG